jgi:hypothetical protein
MWIADGRRSWNRKAPKKRAAATCQIRQAADQKVPNIMKVNPSRRLMLRAAALDYLRAAGLVAASPLLDSSQMNLTGLLIELKAEGFSRYVEAAAHLAHKVEGDQHVVGIVRHHHVQLLAIDFTLQDPRPNFPEGPFNLDFEDYQFCVIYRDARINEFAEARRILAHRECHGCQLL